ncbi:hypothetical protein TanjilG_02276 [Lupinus angustifolius]|uniref:Peptidase A1 domain-containing protein n=1 Tax=Lupinus angustifolius TaxID=3871 RepID=A0A4P1QQI8_LUPAN|nr:hypothetical protein TanjilG_02276 [Lupinus angustifolius]
MNRVLYFAIILFHLSIPSSAKPNGLNIDLIHRDSPLSPFYNSSLAHKEVLINAAMRSISRNKAGAVIIPNNGDYLMKIFIGTPPIESLAIVDIGIDHIWVQHSESCSFLKKRACIASTQCSIEISVADAVEYDAVLSPPKPYKLCYELGSMDDDVVPSIKFHFPKVDMHLPKHNVFVNVGNNLCLSIVPTEGVSVLGNSAQVNFKVEFDLKRNTVSFAPTDCTKE